MESPFSWFSPQLGKRTFSVSLSRLTHFMSSNLIRDTVTGSETPRLAEKPLSINSLLLLEQAHNCVLKASTYKSDNTTGACNWRLWTNGEPGNTSPKMAAKINVGQMYRLFFVRVFDKVNDTHALSIKSNRYIRFIGWESGKTNQSSFNFAKFSGEACLQKTPENEGNKSLVLEGHSEISIAS